MKIEVILAAYNRADFTRLTLDGYGRQHDTDFAVAIADDGSTDETRALIERYRGRLAIRHLWQEDTGFRKARIVNRAIATSAADYLILSDNDCIPGRHFVGDHRQAARPGSFVTGRRVDLGPRPTAELLAAKSPDPERLPWLLRHALRGNLKRFEKALRPPAWVQRVWSGKQIGALGANLAVWRTDLLRINGFDEDFQGYGQEEVDLEWRLLAAGVARRSLLGRGVLFHLHHEQRPVSAANTARLQAKKQAGRWRAVNGIARPE